MLYVKLGQSRVKILLATLIALVVFNVGNAQAAISSFSTDFESPTALTDDNWAGYVNVFSPDCSSQYWYGYPYTISNSGPQVAALALGASSQVANIYSDYDNGNQVDGCVEANVYQQFAISAGDEGTYEFTYDVELPPDPNNVGTDVNGFIKVLSNDFQILLDSAIAPSVAGSMTLTITITTDMVGGWLQFGFNNYSTNYDPTGMYYDNVNFAPAQTTPPITPPDPGSYEGVPTLSTLGLLALLLLIGATAGIVLIRRS